MFDSERLKVLLVQYLCVVLGGLFGCCAGLTVLFTGVMVVGVFRGEWAILHLFAMMSIAGAFAMLSATFLALFGSSRGAA